MSDKRVILEDNDRGDDDPPKVRKKRFRRKKKKVNLNVTIDQDKQDVTQTELYDKISRLVMSENELKRNGYPRPHPTDSGSAVIPNNPKINDYNTRIRKCRRCKTTYQVDDCEMPTSKDNCRFKYKDSWCSSTYHTIHGYDRPSNWTGYVSTKPVDCKPSAGYGVFAIDCEMCSTVYGLELTKITVIDISKQVVYETMVKPLATILDYNTKWSGITERDMKGVTTRLSDVQNKLLELINEKTVVIGHGLEHDFKALKLLHSTVVDTSQLYPHEKGKPYTPSLQYLARNFLKRSIQIKGHDSREDALAALELVLRRV